MLKSVVCVKQVPDIAELKIDPVTHTLIRIGAPSIVNPYDKVALEEALLVRERFGGKVTAISMGPPQAKMALEECLAMGADDAILLTDRVMAAADTLATAYTLYRAIRNLEFDIVFCGQKAIDAETGQVGPQLAELLDLPHICYVKKLEIFESEKKVIVHRKKENGYEIVEGPLPIVLTITKDLTEPRLPTLKGIIQSKRKNIRVVSAAELGGEVTLYGLKGSPTIVSRVFTPPPRGAGIILQGPPSETVRKLVEILVEKGLLGRRKT